MKNNLTILYLLLLSIAAFLFSLTLFTKQKILAGTIFIQEYFNEYNEKKNEVYLLSNEKLNISVIKKILLETKQGFLELNSSSLKYSEEFIKVEIENISVLKYPNNDVLIYSENILILGFIKNVGVKKL
ncbi:hypothetical protein [Spiroplasma taiwanense]|uniref:Transmembrane protein n=1 Tax=Spiroplasma taiwanense CT-1 TaxID=1276220 RepID=S5M0A2_9MOLU|nr:hypothetical protein [Spiroplasma taiwanense]AGR41422.1 hypothetical protein STAIW_v1c08340 [Spiroplasma taiwanense CT-1]